MINTNFNRANFNRVNWLKNTGEVNKNNQINRKDAVKNDRDNKFSISEDAKYQNNDDGFNDFGMSLSNFAFDKGKGKSLDKVEERINDLWVPCIIGGGIGGSLFGPAGTLIGVALGTGVALAGGVIWGGIEESY